MSVNDLSPMSLEPHLSGDHPGMTFSSVDVQDKRGATQRGRRLRDAASGGRKDALVREASTCG